MIRVQDLLSISKYYKCYLEDVNGHMMALFMLLPWDLNLNAGLTPTKKQNLPL